MKDCPTCEGEGTVTVRANTLTDDGWEESPPVEMDCSTCDGEGVLSEQKIEQLERQRNMWCDCEVDTDVTHHPDGDTQVYNGIQVSKHHWSCNECGLLKQLG